MALRRSLMSFETLKVAPFSHCLIRSESTRCMGLGWKSKVKNTEKFLKKVVARPKGANKVTVVGMGAVGSAISTALLAQRVTDEVCLFDIKSKKLFGHYFDLVHGSTFLKSPTVMATTEFEDTAESRVVIITSGARRKEGEDQKKLITENVKIVGSLVPQLVEHSPDAIIIMVSNPVDIMSYLAWKLSDFPYQRVLGTGTSIDSARFRFFIAQRLGVSPSAVEGVVIGEHGESLVPVWSSVSVAGTRLIDLNPKMASSADPDKWDEVRNEVVKASGEVIKKKGKTSTAIGFCVADITKAILSNENRIIPVSTQVQGYHGLTDEVYVSLPCLINSKGATTIINQNLTPAEKTAFLDSVDQITKLLCASNLIV